MGLIVKEPEGSMNIDPVPEGMHHAVCYGLYDLGTHYQEQWDKSIHKVLIQWELPEERIEVDKDNRRVNLPRAISKQYTFSLHSKAELRKDLESWRGKQFTEKELQGFDLIKVLGVNCMLQVIHRRTDKGTFANVTSVVPLLKNMPKRQPENEPRYFSFEEHHSNIPANTPDWIVEIIKSAEEWGQEAQEPEEQFPARDQEEDDILF